MVPSGVEQNTNKIVPMYSARVEDLRTDEYVGVICDGCGQAGDIAVTTIQDRVPGFRANAASPPVPPSASAPLLRAHS